MSLVTALIDAVAYGAVAVNIVGSISNYKLRKRLKRSYQKLSDDLTASFMQRVFGGDDDHLRKLVDDWRRNAADGDELTVTITKKGLK
jgi:hypothetical protein